MRNYIIFIVLLSFGFISCDDGDNYYSQMEKERDVRSEYLSKNGISDDFLLKDAGIYFQILKTPIDADNAKSIKIGDKVIVYYTGYVLDGKVFDSNIISGKFEPLIIWITGSRQGYMIKNGVTSGTVIAGWVPALLNMKEGMSARIVVPSSLAYGMVARPGIPAFSTLIFDLELEKVIPQEKEK